jgi:hypothetical protein
MKKELRIPALEKDKKSKVLELLNPKFSKNEKIRKIID